MLNKDDFFKIDIRVGTIVDASVNKKTRVPAYKMKIDFGKLGIKNSSAQITDLYTPETLIGRQVICVFNLTPVKISEVKSEVLVLGTITDKGVVLLNVDEKVENGLRIS